MKQRISAWTSVILTVLTALFLMLALTSVTSAEVIELNVTPEVVLQGKTLSVSGKASPGEEIWLNSSFGSCPYFIDLKEKIVNGVGCITHFLERGGCLAIAFGTKKSLLFGFEALFALLFLPFLNCWTASEDKKILNSRLLNPVLFFHRKKRLFMYL